MDKKILILPLAIFLFASILLFLPVQSVQAKLSASSGNKSLLVNSGETYTYKVNVFDSSLTASQDDFQVDDKVRMKITANNNSATSGWEADIVWGTMEWYNHTEDQWYDLDLWTNLDSVSPNENAICGYNSTNTISAQPATPLNILCNPLEWAPAPDLGHYPFVMPQNRSAINETIRVYILDMKALVNKTIIPASGVAGNWTYVMIEATNYIHEWILNKKGVVTSYRLWDVGGYTGKSLVVNLLYELELVSFYNEFAILGVAGAIITTDAGSGGTNTVMFTLIALILAGGILGGTFWFLRKRS